MRKFLNLFFCVSLGLLLLPLLALNSSAKSETAQVLSPQKVQSVASKKSFKVLDTETNTVTEYSLCDYLFGVVAAEMPALYHEEALKAQAVAAYSFACYKSELNKNEDYDITNDHTADQSFITEQAAREKWGEKADEYCQKIKAAISSVEGYAITYKGAVINAVYHAISFGKTESAKNVWGKQVSYLSSVTSEWDILSENYISQKSFAADEFKALIEKEVKPSQNASSYLGKITKTESGYVKTVELCGKAVSGEKLRQLLSLRSPCFEAEFSNNTFSFTVYGYGHGVGMSQNGANYMAKQGSSFKEILNHYYKDCKIEKIT